MKSPLTQGIKSGKLARNSLKLDLKYLLSLNKKNCFLINFLGLSSNFVGCSYRHSSCSSMPYSIIISNINSIDWLSCVCLFTFFSLEFSTIGRSSSDNFDQIFGAAIASDSKFLWLLTSVSFLILTI